MPDSANYNAAPVNITKSVTILAIPGALGSVVAKAGNALNIGTAGMKVALRNLVIVPPGGPAAALVTFLQSVTRTPFDQHQREAGTDGYSRMATAKSRRVSGCVRYAPTVLIFEIGYMVNLNKNMFDTGRFIPRFETRSRLDAVLSPAGKTR